VSFNVLLIPEDPVKDGYVLKPIIEAMMRAAGKPQARVVVCVDPRFHGTSQALRWQFIQQALSRNAGMFHLYLLCVDRDGDVNRQGVLDSLEIQARTFIARDRAFLAEHAWQEIEVWLLAGHDLPRKWVWKAIRDEPHPKERYYLPFAESRGVLDLPGEGRDKLAREAASHYDRIRGRCKEDIQRLESRIRAWTEDRG
jgi:hypothetical protein